MEPSEVVSLLLRDIKEKPARPPTRAELLGLDVKAEQDDDLEAY